MSEGSLGSENKNETPRESVFHEDNVAAYTLMTLLQMRDAAYLSLYIQAREAEGDYAAMVDDLEALHASGKIMFPPPFVA